MGPQRSVPYQFLTTHGSVAHGPTRIPGRYFEYFTLRLDPVAGPLSVYIEGKSHRLDAYGASLLRGLRRPFRGDLL